MAIKLSDHFSYSRLFRFVFPSIIMMVFTSIYGIVDGFFVSNFAGNTAFASVNFTLPFLMGLSAIGFMVGAGGSALVAMRLGEGNEKKAKQTFSLLVYLVIIVGLVLAIIGQVVLEPVIRLLGASEDMVDLCVIYGRINLCSLPFFMLQNMFQSFLVTAEKPKLGLGITITAGITNMVLDAVLVGFFNFGIVGAGVATAISETLGGLIPLLYFIFPNKSRLSLVKAPVDFRSIGKACSNGASEFMSNLSMSLVNMLYNIQLMRFAGEDGISAYGVIMYVNFVFVSIYLGYSIGVAPVIGYNYGAQKNSELKNIFKKSLIVIAVFAIAMEILAQSLSGFFANIFVGYDEGLYNITHHAFTLFSLSFLFMGFNIFGSAFFTALNNGKISATISFGRSLVFQVIMIFLLPVFLGLDGIWLSAMVAEGLSLIITSVFLLTNRKKYKYL